MPISPSGVSLFAGLWGTLPDGIIYSHSKEECVMIDWGQILQVDVCKEHLSHIALLTMLTSHGAQEIQNLSIFGDGTILNSISSLWSCDPYRLTVRLIATYTLVIQKVKTRPCLRFGRFKRFATVSSKLAIRWECRISRAKILKVTLDDSVAATWLDERTVNPHKNIR